MLTYNENDMRFRHESQKEYNATSESIMVSSNLQKNIIYM